MQRSQYLAHLWADRALAQRPQRLPRHAAERRSNFRDHERGALGIFSGETFCQGDRSDRPAQAPAQCLQGGYRLLQSLAHAFQSLRDAPHPTQQKLTGIDFLVRVNFGMCLRRLLIFPALQDTKHDFVQRSRRGGNLDEFGERKASKFIGRR